MIYTFKKVESGSYQCNEIPELKLERWYDRGVFWDFFYKGNCLTGTFYSKRDALNRINTKGLDLLNMEVK